MKTLISDLLENYYVMNFYTEILNNEDWGRITSESNNIDNNISIPIFVKKLN